ncbi:MAG: carbohydrate kinase [Clostridia bacterium]|nr:carbohydrate kinase [Clostridia bacterium]
MEKSHILAYDLGTSGVKGAIVTLGGEVVDTATADYPLYTPVPGHAEQDPVKYWEGVCEVTRLVLGKAGISPDTVAGIAIGTLWKGIIPVDSEGNVLHNSIIWLDARAADQAERLNARFGADIFSAADYWPKLMWLRENRPDVIERAEVIFEVNSYLKWRMTGEAAMDISNSYVRSPDPALEQKYRDILDFIDIPEAKFPPVVNAETLVGHVTEYAAEEMGLVAGIPVFAGNNDIQAITVGAGCSDIGGVHMYFGSSGWIGYTIPHQSKEIYVSGFDRDRDITIYGMQAIGLSFNWAVKKLYAAEYESMGGKVFAFVDKDIADIPAGSEGVFATPWFYGERPPMFSHEARGNFLNLGPGHDRRHMTHAVMEGVCYQLKMGSLYNYRIKGFPRPEVISVIGGGSCSDIWMQMLADVMNTPVRVPAATRHAGAVGTAYSALIGLGICSDYAEAAKRVRIERTFEPIPANVKTYEAGFKVFEKLYAALEPMFMQTNKQK